MNVYFFDHETKIFTHSGSAELDPLEKELNNIERYLLPADGTFTPPPSEIPVGMSAKWNGEIWELVSTLSLKDYENAIQELLDRRARNAGYDNSYTCLSYLNSNNAKRKDDAEKFNLWRDKVWDKANEILKSWQDGVITTPSVADVMEQLAELGE